MRKRIPTPAEWHVVNDLFLTGIEADTVQGIVTLPSDYTSYEQDLAAELKSAHGYTINYSMLPRVKTEPNPEFVWGKKRKRTQHHAD